MNILTLRGITRHPTEDWMVQMARRAVDSIDGSLLPVRFVLHDRDSKFCASFQDTLHSVGIQPLNLPARSPNLKDYASHCTSFALTDVIPLARPRSESL